MISNVFYNTVVLSCLAFGIQYPSFRTPTLQTSLYESGKSRADLWAFAAIAAVEFGAETNNRICDGSWDVLNYGGGYSNKPNVNTSDISVGWLNGYIQCREVKGQPDCNVNFPRSFKFQTGRKDCTEFGDEPYMGKCIFMVSM